MWLKKNPQTKLFVAIIPLEVGISRMFGKRFRKILLDRLIEFDCAFLHQAHDHAGKSRFAQRRRCHYRFGVSGNRFSTSREP